MDDEIFLSGYCRKTDCSRTVTAELADGHLVCADCDYGSCIYQTGCPIAEKIRAYEA